MLYKKQRNYCVSLLRKSKTINYANLDEKKSCDKSCVKEQSNLVEKGEILKMDIETAEVLNTFLEI